MNKYIVSFEKYNANGILRCYTYTVDSWTIDDALDDVLDHTGFNHKDIVAPNIDAYGDVAYSAIGYPEPIRHINPEDYK